MSTDKSNSLDYKSLNSSARNGGANSDGLKTLKPQISNPKPENHLQSLVNPLKPSVKVPEVQIPSELIKPQIKAPKALIPSEQISVKKEIMPAESVIPVAEKPISNGQNAETAEPGYAELQKAQKSERQAKKDFKLINNDGWLTRNGHSLTYVGVYLFTIIVLFRPYELIPGLGFLSMSAFIVALATLFIFLPTQLTTEGSLTTLSTEVKAVIGLTLTAVVTMPIAKDPGLAWETFNDVFIKAVVIFVVMVNVLRTRKRLVGLMWVSFGIGIYLSFNALYLYSKGEFHVEEYRVSADVKGMFENPNEMALHLVMMVPLMFTMGLASKKILMRIIYFGSAILLTAANFVTFSRGGFLGLIAAAAVLVWKLGRKDRLKVSLVSLFVGLVVIVAAPGNYGVRILSIFGLAADPVGSSDQRQELLKRSLLVTARNPWGIGIGNFPIVSIHMLVTHNAFTQVSSELGLLGLIFYLVFMISPFRKLSAIERTEFAAEKQDWFYYVSIGLQASLVAYWVSSFFAAVAYNWFIYYLIAYAVGFRRVYQIEKELKEEVQPTPLF